MKTNVLAITIMVCSLFSINYNYGQWSTNPAINNAISTAANNQESPFLISDGSGGAIITWGDTRSGPNTDIYAQRINAAGVVQWTTNGVAICVATNDQYNTPIISDGSGGAIIIWQDYRSGTDWDIYAQRINAAGIVLWTTDGVAISTAADDQGDYTIISDGSGGAIITWEDYRSGSDYDIYSQRINAAGIVQWDTNGVVICAESNHQLSPINISDGSGGAIITWRDHRSGLADIYAQRINTAGILQWVPNGVDICTATDSQFNRAIVSDGSGGAISIWLDYRSGTDFDIYAQRINAAGIVQWNTNGVAICTETDTQFGANSISDGSGGAIITWFDYRNGTNWDIYSQRINASGAVQWTTDGSATCSYPGNQKFPSIVADGGGGAIITWQDDRNGTDNDIYAQRIDASGAMQWTSVGVEICTAINDQDEPSIVSDGAGGAIITWMDRRSVSSSDVYAQRITANGDFSMGFEENIMNNAITIFPNPGNGVFTIQSEIEISNTEIMDMQGRKISYHLISTTGEQSKIELLNVSTGTYFVLVNTVNGVYRTKIVVEK